MTWLIALGAYLAAFTLFLYWWARLPQHPETRTR